MRDEFDWDDANLQHIAAHQVSAEEAEQVLLNDPLELEAQYLDNEERFPMIGVTNAGRFLVVVATERYNRARVITAYPAEKRLIEMYLKSRF